jgi:Spy/CpxP family protein refolding chaperone
VAKQVRSGLSGKSPDEGKVMSLSRRYGELDGQLSYEMATRFASVYRTLTPQQKAAMVKLRNQDIFPEGHYLYADPAKEEVSLDTASLFGK